MRPPVNSRWEPLVLHLNRWIGPCLKSFADRCNRVERRMTLLQKKLAMTAFCLLVGGYFSYLLVSAWDPPPPTPTTAPPPTDSTVRKGMAPVHPDTAHVTDTIHR